MVALKPSGTTPFQQKYADHGNLPGMSYPLGLNTNYIDMVLSNFASAQLTNMLGSDEGLGVKQLAKVFLLFSVDEISKCVKSVLHELYKALQDKYQTLFAKLLQHAKTARMRPRALLHLLATNWIVSCLRTQFDRRGPGDALPLPTIGALNEATSNDPSLNTTLEVPFAFANCLVEYMVRNPERCSYTVEAERSLKVVNLEEVEVAETWYDMQFQYSTDVSIRILDRCAFVFTQSRDSRHLKHFLGAVGERDTIDLASINRFSQLLPDTLEEIRDKIESWSDAAYGRTAATRSGFVCQLGGDRSHIRTPDSVDEDAEVGSDFPFEINLMLLIKKCGCPQLDVTRSFYDYALLLFVLTNSSGFNLPKWRSMNATINQQLKRGDRLSLFGSVVIKVELDEDDKDSLQQSLDLELPHIYNRSMYSLDITDKQRQQMVTQLDRYWAQLKLAGTSLGSRASSRVNSFTKASKASDTKVLNFELSAALDAEQAIGSAAADGTKGDDGLRMGSADRTLTKAGAMGLQTTLVTAFDQFIHEVSSTSVRNANNIGKVEVYRVVLERTNESVEVDNPQYKTQYQKYKAMQSLLRGDRQPATRSSGKGIGSIKTKRSRRDMDDHVDVEVDNTENVDDAAETEAVDCHRYSGLLWKDMPTRKLLKTTETVHVVAKHITSVEKTFDTLYLRAIDKARLHSVLDLFHTRKDMIKKLSLPLKLGLLLHGLPGTGKTSTINAVASYLQKDIYYVSLKQIRTDNELLLVFQHINKNCSSGGLVVFEEIDLQSSVVVRQEFKHVHTGCVGAATARAGRGSNIDVDDKPLTLDALLNVLQGSLTSENTCFIATTNHIERLEPALFRSGRFDLCIEMKLADRHQIATIYKQFMGRSLASEMLGTLPENHWSPADVIFFLTTKLFSDQDDEMIVKELRQVTPSRQLCTETEKAGSKQSIGSTNQLMQQESTDV